MRECLAPYRTHYGADHGSEEAGLDVTKGPRTRAILSAKTAKKTAAKTAKGKRSRRPFIGRLDNLKSCRQELARLYRTARMAAGDSPDTSDAYRLAAIISSTAKLIEQHELAARVDELEALIARRDRENGENGDDGLRVLRGGRAS